MKKIMILIMAFVYLSLNANVPVYANELRAETQVYSVYSAGLISKKAINISANSNTIMLTAKTECNDEMKYVGLKDVVIEQSSDGVNWSKYKPIGDLLGENSTMYVTNNLSLATVTSGYYYRVTCSHYAKEKGLFGSSEKDDTTSNSIYIKKI